VLSTHGQSCCVQAAPVHTTKPSMPCIHSRSPHCQASEDCWQLQTRDLAAVTPTPCKNVPEPRGMAAIKQEASRQVRQQ
jgi:hypothetical protein